MKIGFLGGGNMAQALIGGIAVRHPDSTFVVVEPHAPTRDVIARLAPDAVVVESASAALADCEAVVLAVKPQVLREALAPAVAWLDRPLVVSIAAGIRTAEIARWLKGSGNRSTSPLVRAMPNTPALIGEGIAALYATPGVDAARRALAETLLSAVGQTLWVDDEASLDAVTAVSGSGPAYVFSFIEALERGARELGLPDGDARRLAIATFVGASRLAAASEEPLEVLRERVTSKGGTTYAALTRMREGGVPDAIVDGIHAAARRSVELGDTFANEG